MTVFLIAVAFILHFVAADVRQQRWSYYVKAGTEECAFLYATATEQIETSVEVSTPGLRDIRLIIAGPTGQLYDKVVYNREFEKIGKISVPAVSSGIHKICTSNSVARFTTKKITLYITVRDTETSTLENAKLEHLGPIVDSIIQVSEGLDKVVAQQRQLRIDEQILRTEQEDINNRVQWLSTIRGAGLLVLSLVQLYLIRSWFNNPDRRRTRV